MAITLDFVDFSGLPWAEAILDRMADERTNERAENTVSNILLKTSMTLQEIADLNEMPIERIQMIENKLFEKGLLNKKRLA